MKNLIFYRLLISVLLLVGGIANANPNALLGDSIKKRAAINANTPTEERLALYAKIFQNLDQIVSSHPTSDQAIKILSNQKIGDFDPQSLRGEYIQELTQYYDIVCEANPNFACLGFVSLSAGQEGCVKAETARDVIEAHQNLKNAARVFIGQREDPSYVSLTLNEYRGCIAKSKFKATDYSKDLFAADLVSLLTQSGRKNIAKAVIENMKTPAFKVISVLELSKNAGKPFDQAFYDRLKKYIEQKVKDKNGNRQLAALDLTLSNFQRGSIKIETSDVRWGYRTGRNWGPYKKQCDPFVVRSILDRVFSLQLNLVELDPSRRGYGKSSVPDLMQDVSKHLYDILNSCRDTKSDTKGFSLSAELHGQILLISKKKAAEFREGVLNRDWTGYEQVESAVQILGQNKALFEAQYGLRKSAKGNDLVKFGYILKSDRALYPVFKQMVDYGHVCEASKLLFQRIKGKNFYDDAIEYMIDAKNIDMTTKHKCGDAELELLLK